MSKIFDDIQKLSPTTKLLIVTKNRSKEDLRLLINNGNKLFAENKVQEASHKFTDIDVRSKLQLHLIGPLQSNKTKLALTTFDVIQTVDRKKLVDVIFEEKKKLNFIRTNQFFIQVNIGKEEQKNGVNPEDFEELYEYCLIKNLPISGAMCIPPANEDPIYYFEKMVHIKSKFQNLQLSMGMSSDYQAALKLKSDFIRVGSYIFEN